VGSAYSKGLEMFVVGSAGVIEPLARLEVSFTKIQRDSKRPMQQF